MPLVLLLLSLAEADAATGSSRVPQPAAIASESLASESLATDSLATLAADLRRDIGFLASDALSGRGRGTEGGFATAAFLAGHLRAAGWEPFDGAYRHEFGGRGFADRDDRRMQNVLAVSRTSRGPDDPYLVVSAHYDHVGDGLMGGSRGPRGLVHNGADDNASGTSVLLSLARSLAARPLPPTARPVLLAFFDGEEGGLLGSRHFVRERLARPTTTPEDTAVAPVAVAALLNLDMVGMLKDDRLFVYGASTSPAMATLLPAAHELALEPVLLAEHCPASDHMPFFEQKVPYLLLHTGLHETYHSPRDDADRLNFEGLARIARLSDRLVRSLATARAIPFASESEQLPMRRRPPAQVDTLTPDRLLDGAALERGIVRTQDLTPADASDGSSTSDGASASDRTRAAGTGQP